MTSQQVRVGQVWQRKHDGRQIRVERLLQVGSDLNPQIDVVWRGVGKPGRGAMFEDSLRGRYELVEGDHD